VKAQFANVGTTPKSMTPDEFGEFVAEDTAKWAKVIEFPRIVRSFSERYPVNIPELSTGK